MKEYNLTFSEALEITMGGMFIRSNIMKDGIYLRVDDTDALSIYDGFGFSKKLGEFTITKNSFGAKWKAFNVANVKSLTL
jgi:hypothetical protein